MKKIFLAILAMVMLLTLCSCTHVCSVCGKMATKSKKETNDFRYEKTTTRTYYCNDCYEGNYPDWYDELWG